MAEENKSLFMEAMQGVTPLKNSKAKHPAHDPKKAKQLGEETIRKLKRRKHQSRPTDSQQQNRQTLEPIEKVTALDTLLFNQKGVRLQELAKLKRGSVTFDPILDLHGCTVEQAETMIHEFIRECLARKRRYIRIIHGKGYNSESEYPALKNLTNQVLRNIDGVIAFSSAPEKDGGKGAVNILLKSVT